MICSMWPFLINNIKFASIFNPQWGEHIDWLEWRTSDPPAVLMFNDSLYLIMHFIFTPLREYMATAQIFSNC